MNEPIRLKQKSQQIHSAIVISAALVICTIIGSRTILKVKGFSNTIRVTGAASTLIKSDYGIWTASFSVSAPSIEAAYPLLDSDLINLSDFVAKQNLDSNDYNISPVNISRNFNREGQIVDYSLNRTIRVELNDVDRIKNISEKASELIKDGVMLESHPPQYLVSELDTLKVAMIRAATENAKLRAEELARTTGKKVGAPRSASVGVFQIRPRHSQEVSSYGISDVSSIEKEIVLTVHIEFLID